MVPQLNISGGAAGMVVVYVFRGMRLLFCRRACDTASMPPECVMILTGGGG
jgi:hypothetical protein